MNLQQALVTVVEMLCRTLVTLVVVVAVSAFLIPLFALIVDGELSSTLKALLTPTIRLNDQVDDRLARREAQLQRIRDLERELRVGP